MHAPGWRQWLGFVLLSTLIVGAIGAASVWAVSMMMDCGCTVAA